MSSRHITKLEQPFDMANAQTLKTHHGQRSSFLARQCHVGDEVKKSFCDAGTSPLSFNNFEMSSSV
jgi:hypothetical protein